MPILVGMECDRCNDTAGHPINRKRERERERGREGGVRIRDIASDQLYVVVIGWTLRTQTADGNCPTSSGGDTGVAVDTIPGRATGTKTVAIRPWPEISV